jgi:hypothetical protein
MRTLVQVTHFITTSHDGGTVAAAVSDIYCNQKSRNCINLFPVSQLELAIRKPPRYYVPKRIKKKERRK